MRDQEPALVEQQLRVLSVTLDYPPPVLGGYGVMCAQVCTWLKQRGHEVLVLATLPPEPGMVSAGPDTEEGAVPVRRILRSYWDGSANLDPPFQEALTVEQHNQAQMQDVLATYHPDVVTFWHMGAMSLGLITTTARLGFPLVFVIEDDWLCYGGWADAWLRWWNAHPEQAVAVEQSTGLPIRLPDLGKIGIFCFVSACTKRRAEQIGGWHFPRAEIRFPGLSPTEFPPLIQVPDCPWRWRLLWVGRVIEEKGVETAISALSYLPPDATLDIVGPIEPAYRQRYALSIVRRQALSARFWPLQAFSVHSRSHRVRLPFHVAALDQVDGIERAVNRVMPPEEEAGKGHYLAVAVGQECRDETRHRPVQQNPEPPAPGNEKKERHERERSPEDHGPEPGMRYPLAKLPEEDEVQSRRQEQAACYLAN
jgi:glycosyltransferase involved in cell wall biosynthesis